MAIFTYFGECMQKIEFACDGKFWPFSLAFSSNRAWNCAFTGVTNDPCHRGIFFCARTKATDLWHLLSTTIFGIFCQCADFVNCSFSLSWSWVGNLSKKNSPKVASCQPSDCSTFCSLSAFAVSLFHKIRPIKSVCNAQGDKFLSVKDKRSHIRF